MIGQQADALLAGDAKQRSALYAFLRSAILAASSAAPLESLRVLLEGGAVLFDFLECEREVSQWRRFEIGALDADVGSRAQQLQALLARPEHCRAHQGSVARQTR